jgi:hypothetical protein
MDRFFLGVYMTLAPKRQLAKPSQPANFAAVETCLPRCQLAVLAEPISANETHPIPGKEFTSV